MAGRWRWPTTSRAAYHAAACIAANHVVALLGQVERVAASAGLPLDAFLDLTRAAVEDVSRLGPTPRPSPVRRPVATGRPWAATATPSPPRSGPPTTPGSGWPVRLAGRADRDDAVTVPTADVPAADVPAEVAVTDEVATPARAEAPAGPPARRTAIPGHRGRAGRRVSGVRLRTTTAEFSDDLQQARAAGRRVGLVPTMGALHAGHRALHRAGRRRVRHGGGQRLRQPAAVRGPRLASTRVPEGWPTTWRSATAGAAVVLAPPVAEMYPDGPGQPALHGAGHRVDRALGGAARPGHFDGVATVVAKLFALAGRCRAYFGEKDFQQLAVVRRMVADLSFPVEVVGCPTVREADGLALSSRNVRLSAAERAAAPVALARRSGWARRRWPRAPRRRPRSAQPWPRWWASEPLVTLDYAAAVDPVDLSEPTVLRAARTYRLLIAAAVGPVRLIDNASAQTAGAGRASPVADRHIDVRSPAS